MIIFRPIKEKDLNSLIDFANTSSIGMMSLPKNRLLLKKKIEKSINSFQKDVKIPQNETYQFVIEDTTTGKVGGTSGIYSKTGVNVPAYFYRVNQLRSQTESLLFPNEMRVLYPVSYSNGPSEICALFLSPEYRKGGLGRLLSLSRFLFIAAFLHRFDQTMTALMRAYFRKDLTCPFWNSVGKKLLDIEFSSLFEMIQSGKMTQSEITYPHPLCVSILPEETRKIIGKTHPNTIPAMKMLNEEGFTYTHEIDVLDGGPKIGSKTNEIRTIKKSRQATVAKISKNLNNGEHYLISNTKINFRACLGNIIKLNETEVQITENIAKELKIEIGENILYVLPKPERQ